MYFLISKEIQRKKKSKKTLSIYTCLAKKKEDCFQSTKQTKMSQNQPKLPVQPELLKPTETQLQLVKINFR